MADSGGREKKILVNIDFGHEKDRFWCQQISFDDESSRGCFFPFLSPRRF